MDDVPFRNRFISTVTCATCFQVGYKKEQLDPDTYQYVMDWYNSTKGNGITEKWPPDNTYVNHWKVNTVMKHAPFRVHEVMLSFVSHPLNIL